MKTGIGAGFACALVLAGCGAEGESPQSANSGAVAATEQAPERSSVPAELAERTIGPVSFRYDPARLAAVDTSLAVPPDWERRADGIKLIDSKRQQLMGREECPYGEAGMDLECTPESEGGIAIVMLDEPFADARETLAGDGSRNVTLAGREGVAWSNRFEGRETEYTLLPAGDRTVLIEHRIRLRENPEAAAIEQVKESLRIDS